MALQKKGKYYHYEFRYKGERFQGSTDQTNVNLARLTEAKIRSDAALAYHGVSVKRAPLFT